VSRAAILQAFLDEMLAVELWRMTPDHRMLVTCYRANGRIFFVQTWTRTDQNDGWDIYIPASEQNSAGATLHNARRYIETGAV
jgi:hypothetical protein